MEQWRNIPGYEGRYQVSDGGRVRSVDRYVRSVAKNGTESRRFVPGVEIKPQKHSAGYLQVKMGPRTYIVGPLVLEAFVGPRPEGQQCAHNDGDRHHNALGNLRWATPASNSNDRRAHGTSGRGQANAGAKLTPDRVSAVRDAAGPQRKIAEAFGVAQSTVSKIKLRQRWGHL